MSEDTEQKVKTEVPKRTDTGILGRIGDFLHFLFVKNCRKKLLAIFIAVAAMVYSYGIIVKKDMARSRDVLIKNVSVKINLRNSEKYKLIGDTPKVNLCVVVPSEIPHSEDELIPENFDVTVNANDQDMENGFVKIHLDDVQVKKRLDFEFTPKYFLMHEGDSIHSTMKIPVEKENLASKLFPVHVKIDSTGFSSNFTVAKKECESITVIAPQDIISKLKIQTAVIPLQGHVSSFQERVSFHVFLDTVESHNFIYHPDRRTLCWTTAECGPENAECRKVDAAITIDRYDLDKVEVPVSGILLDTWEGTTDLDYGEILSKINWREMIKKQLTVTVKVSKADREQWEKNRNKAIQAWCDISKSVPDPQKVNVYYCEIKCVLLTAGIDVKIVDFEPKRTQILFAAPVAPKSTDEKSSQSEEKTKDNSSFLRHFFQKNNKAENPKTDSGEK